MQLKEPLAEGGFASFPQMLAGKSFDIVIYLILDGLVRAFAVQLLPPYPIIEVYTRTTESLPLQSFN